MPRPSWDDYLLGLTKVVACRSHDTQTQHGCVIVNEHHGILATGCNGFPRGMKDDSSLPTTRPEKYPWMIHSEVNAISSTRSRADLDGAVACVTGPPCVNCMMQMWQVGIRKVKYIDGYGWAKDEQERAVREEFIRQSGMELIPMKPDLTWLADLVLGIPELKSYILKSILADGESNKPLQHPHKVVLPPIEVDETVTRVHECIRRIMKKQPTTIDDTDTLDALGFDSLDKVTLCMRLEDEFVCEDIPSKEMDKWDTVKDVIDSMKRRSQGSGGENGEV